MAAVSTAKGTKAGIRSNYNDNTDPVAVSLSWKDEDDFIAANSFSLNDRMTVDIAEGKT